MDNREFLSEALVLEGIIKTKKNTVLKHKARREYMSQDFTTDKVSSGNVNGEQNRQDEFLQLEEELKAEIEYYKRRYALIYRTIAEVKDPDKRELLEMRYIQGLTIRQIAAVKSYSSRQIRRKLRAAEKAVNQPKKSG